MPWSKYAQDHKRFGVPDRIQTRRCRHDIAGAILELFRDVKSGRVQVFLAERLGQPQSAAMAGLQQEQALHQGRHELHYLSYLSRQGRGRAVAAEIHPALYWMSYRVGLFKAPECRDVRRKPHG